MLKLPIRLEGGTCRILGNAGECVAECPGGFEPAGEMVLAVNAYPALVEKMKELLGLMKMYPILENSKGAAEARHLLAYLGEKA